MVGQSYPIPGAFVLGKSAAVNQDGTVDQVVYGQTYSGVTQTQAEFLSDSPIVNLRVGRGLVAIADGGYHVP